MNQACCAILDMKLHENSIKTRTMVKHVVLWKLDPSCTNDKKDVIINGLRNRLLELENKISVMKQIRLYLNNEKASGSNFDIMFETTFDTFNDLKHYQSNPEHLKVVEFVKSLKLQRAAIDFSL